MATALRKWALNRLERPRKCYVQRIYNDKDKLHRAIRPGDVVLVEGRSEMSRLIKLFSASHWSHVAFYIGDALIHSSYPHRTKYLNRYGPMAKHLIVEAFSGQGVVVTPLDHYIDNNIRVCRPFGISDSDLKLVIRRVIEKIGHQYDDQNIFDLAKVILHSMIHPMAPHNIRVRLGSKSDLKVICSGMIAKAFQSVGYPIVPALLPKDHGITSFQNNPYGKKLIMRHYSQIMPRDFDLSPNFDIIKFNIIGSQKFDYKSIWARKLDPNA